MKKIILFLFTALLLIACGDKNSSSKSDPIIGETDTAYYLGKSENSATEINYQKIMIVSEKNNINRIISVEILSYEWPNLVDISSKQSYIFEYNGNSPVKSVITYSRSGREPFELVEDGTDSVVSRIGIDAELRSMQNIRKEAKEVTKEVYDKAPQDWSGIYGLRLNNFYLNKNAEGKYQKIKLIKELGIAEKIIRYEEINYADNVSKTYEKQQYFEFEYSGEEAIKLLSAYRLQTDPSHSIEASSTDRAEINQKLEEIKAKLAGAKSVLESTYDKAPAEWPAFDPVE